MSCLKNSLSSCRETAQLSANAFRKKYVVYRVRVGRYNFVEEKYKGTHDVIELIEPEQDVQL